MHQDPSEYASRDDWVFDTMLAIVSVTLILAPYLVVIALFGPVTSGRDLIVSAIAGLAICVGVVLRRHHPLAFMGVTAAFCLLHVIFVPLPFSMLVAVFAAVHAVSRYVRKGVTWTLFFWIPAALGATARWYLAYDDADNKLLRVAAFGGLAFVGLILTAYAIGRRSHDLSEAREEDFARAKEASRTEGANEAAEQYAQDAATQGEWVGQLQEAFGDVLDTMIAHVDDARALLATRPAEADAALEAAVETGRGALADLERMPGGPSPDEAEAEDAFADDPWAAPGTYAEEPWAEDADYEEPDAYPSGVTPAWAEAEEWAEEDETEVEWEDTAPAGEGEAWDEQDAEVEWAEDEAAWAQEGAEDGDEWAEDDWVEPGLAPATQEAAWAQGDDGEAEWAEDDWAAEPGLAPAAQQAAWAPGDGEVEATWAQDDWTAEPGLAPATQQAAWAQQDDQVGVTWPQDSWTAEPGLAPTTPQAWAQGDGEVETEWSEDDWTTEPGLAPAAQEAAWGQGDDQGEATWAEDDWTAEPGLAPTAQDAAWAQPGDEVETEWSEDDWTTEPGLAPATQEAAWAQEDEDGWAEGQADAGWTGGQADPGWAGEQADAGWAGGQADAGWAGEQADPDWAAGQADAGWAEGQADPGWAAGQADAGWAEGQADPGWAAGQADAGWTGEQADPGWATGQAGGWAEGQADDWADDEDETDDGWADGPRLPSATIDDVPVLVQAAGAEYSEVGDRPDIDDVLGLTIYRIVEESLNNVRKHAGPKAIPRVYLDWGDDDVEVSVVNEPTDYRAPRQAKPGEGLDTMAERAEAVGGVLETGPTEEGGFSVWASLPYSWHAEPPPAAAPANAAVDDWSDEAGGWDDQAETTWTGTTEWAPDPIAYAGSSWAGPDAEWSAAVESWESDDYWPATTGVGR